VKWSDHTYHIFGLARGEFSESVPDFLARVYPDDLLALTDVIGLADANGLTDIGDFRIFHADGSIRWVYERGKVFYDAAGKPVRVIGTIQDITERKQAEEQRFELAVEKERVALLKEFIGNMSHDLKTPLTVIKTSLYLLERVTDPERQQSKMETIKQQVLLLEKLIEDVLTMSQLDHTPELLLASVDLNNLLLDVEHKLRPAAENKRLSIRMELNPSIPPILASEGELYRVMVNLVENAIKYTPEMGSVAIRTRLDDALIVTEIMDTGIGISQDELPRIFERFFRANAARSVDIPGTGLGLAIVKRIVDMHDGSIEVESTPGKGSVFRVLLPLNTNAAIQPR
jgi:PAS domain S-box-containing protein